LNENAEKFFVCVRAKFNSLNWGERRKDEREEVAIFLLYFIMKQHQIILFNKNVFSKEAHTEKEWEKNKKK
jgi:hypothetical protein